MSDDKLPNFLETGKDWSRLKTTVPGVFVVKLPPYRGSPTRLVVELNPVNEAGSPKKRRGLVLRSTAELEEYMSLLSNEKLPKLLGMIDSINPKVETRRRRKEEDIIEL